MNRMRRASATVSKCVDASCPGAESASTSTAKKPRKNRQLHKPSVPKKQSKYSSRLP